MHTKTIQKIQKAYIKTYEEDVKIYKDIENSQGTLLLQKCRPLYVGSSRAQVASKEAPDRFMLPQVGPKKPKMVPKGPQVPQDEPKMASRWLPNRHV